MLIDKNRISELFDLCYKDIYRYCLSFVKNEEDAKDLAQQTFIVLVNKASMLEDTNLENWLYRTAHFEICKFHRKNKRELQHTPFRIDNNIDEDNLLSSFCLDTEIDYLIHPDSAIEEYKADIINQLSPKEQQLYHAVFEEKKHYKEIASELGISENTVNVRSFRLRAKLKDILKTTISLILITFYYIFM